MTSYKPISLTAATLTLSRKTHAGATVVVDRAAGSTVTLPAATGTGDKYKLVVKTTITSNSFKVQVADDDDVMTGTATFGQDSADTAVLF